MKLEVLDEKGNVVEELPASKRKGLNRVVWSMRTKPPVVPPAASLAFNSTQGQRIMPGNYTVRLTKGGEVSTMPLVIGRMKLEVLDANGNVVDELPASKRRGLNRVNWSMRTKPPVVPPAASLAFNSAFGQRVLPGTYTVRLTKAGQVTTAPLTVSLDKRATFSVADRQAQFAASERVKGMFERMSKLISEINGIREQGSGLAASASAPADIKAAAAQLTAKADALRKAIVATTEGGAITGEERLRENVDEVYGAINSVEARPTTYQLARIDALERELKDVEAQWAAFRAGDLAAFNAKLQGASLRPLKIAEVHFDEEQLARGGRISALVRGLVGTRFYGDLKALTATGEKD
jgi:hypothetical protein